jgi:hypothetical protein
MLAVPILLTPAGKGNIDDDHPLCHGVRHHFPAVRAYWENADEYTESLICRQFVRRP